MTSDDTAIPCETCGALVAEASAELHASWHQKMADESNPTRVIDELTRQARLR